MPQGPANFDDAPAEPGRAVTASERPVLIIDGNCGFCRFWIARWQEITGESVEYLAQQEPACRTRFPDLAPTDLEQAIHLVEPTGSVTRGAEALVRVLATNPDWTWTEKLYRRSRWVATWAERGYEFVARHRPGFSRVTRLLWGDSSQLPTFQISREVFLAGLAIVHLVAFASLWVQMDGLIGERGILSAQTYLQDAARQLDGAGIGWDRFRMAPTLFWFNASDRALHVGCLAGIILAVLALTGVARAAAFAGLWLIYLSFVTAGQEFLAFQWDGLLLEVTAVAVFYAPWVWSPRVARAAPSRTLARWLGVGLLFQLMLESGLVKLRSGDPTWANLTALQYHYWTQPLPGPWAWFVHQLPPWVHRGCCALMFLGELVLPWLLWAPRHPRLLAAAGLILLQVLILLTGNYTFFNALTLLLCLLVVDDSTWRRGRWRPAAPSPEKLGLASSHHPIEQWRKKVLLPITVICLAVRVPQLVAYVVPMAALPVLELQRWLSPFRTLNGYGLFAVMTTRRPEIVVEGSADGIIWQVYEFRYKPGDVMIRPAQVAPHQPRLDWQMWFAALGDVRENPWFVRFCVRLLQGSPDVLALLKHNPFPDRPPRYVRARLFDYRFSTTSERRATGAWWVREERGMYCPPISLRGRE